jgi:hypothetical protein
MYRVKVEPMPDNPDVPKVGDSSGSWKVVVYDYGAGNVIDKNALGNTHKENLPYEEARDLASSLEDKLNASS